MKKILTSLALCLAAIAALAQTEPVKFAFLSDVHLCTDSPRIGNLEKCIEDINSQRDIQFSIFAGDITEFGADHEIALAKEVIDKLNNKYYIVAGNHDAKWSESGCNTFAKVFGYEQFEFEAGGIKFLGCNCGPNMRMAPALLPHETLVWLDSTAKATPAEQPVILVNHYPQDTSVLNYFQVMNTIKQCNVQLLLGGHWHKNTILDYDGVPGILGRSPDRGKEIGYNIIEIRNGILTAHERIVVDKDGKPCTLDRKPWYSLAMSYEPLYMPHKNWDKDDPYGLPADFPFLKFDVNKQYPDVTEIWRYQDEGDIGCGAIPAGNLVVFANTQGIVKAINAKTGAEVWRYATEGKVFSTPAVWKKRVVIGSTDGYIYCLSLKRGKLLWKYKCEKSVLATPSIMNGIAYIGSSDNVFRAIDVAKGTLVWEHKGIKGFVECKPYVDAEQLVFGDWGNTLYSLDPATGKEQWTWSTKGSRMFSPAAVYPVKSNGKIFVVTPERKTYAIDAKTGEQLWSSSGGRESIGISPEGDRIYVKTMGDYMQAYSTTSADAEKIWEANVGFGYEIAPTPSSCAGNLLFVPTDKGNLFCLDAGNGSTIWKHKISVALINSIIPMTNNRLLVSTMDGVVTLIQY